eukprot:CAMPEP_0203965942 /NCGR_PEP_ID=MMETSP0359-20131031/95311_1 /ASSEMBLY_ACC=CAM_ASM_000338 /TAXON_ID=268821 /ORGANISM="Scrippsiella Hangoei, Strain SHTV-5" /LENGTH=79 /DNA_ID=CAMNT_0050903099 /DNA_START=42 /DNA_END=278 /DNA_ORIENTATION=+
MDSLRWGVDLGVGNALAVVACAHVRACVRPRTRERHNSCVADAKSRHARAPSPGESICRRSGERRDPWAACLAACRQQQ